MAGYCSREADGLGWLSAADNRLLPWWAAARNGLAMLGASGSTFVRLQTRGRYKVTVTRWLEDFAAEPSHHLSSIVRELKRASGQPIWEPES
jgi:hypothetical protein